MPLRLSTPIYAEGFGTTDDTRPEFVRDGIHRLETIQVRYILWTPRLESPGDPTHPETYHLAPFLDFLRKHYRRVLVFSDRDEIWERM